MFGGVWRGQWAVGDRRIYPVRKRHSHLSMAMEASPASPLAAVSRGGHDLYSLSVPATCPPRGAQPLACQLARVAERLDPGACARGDLARRRHLRRRHRHSDL
eukprot:scaffold63868_cov36-Phaeocystis_antarctica.AAC.1